MAFYGLSNQEASWDSGGEEINPLKGMTHNLSPSLTHNTTCQGQQVDEWTGVGFKWLLDAWMFIDYTYEYHSQPDSEDMFLAN